MKEIPLAGGLMALVDDEDYELVSKYSWWAAPDRRTVYARAYIRGSSPREKYVRMHRLILNAPKGLQVDHKNLNGLDCRRDNLRFATNSQNQANGKKYSTSSKGAPTSRYKGVGWHKVMKAWSARVQINERTVVLGYFASETDAALAYNKAASEYYGEFARLNVVEA